MMTSLDDVSMAKVEMLIRKPVKEVFEAFIDPVITTKFWFSKSSGRLETGKRVRWEWEMLKALLEYGIVLNLVSDRFPDAQVTL